MKCEIGLNRTVGKGSNVYIELPILKEIGSSDSPSVTKQINVEKNKVLILYIKDNHSNREVVRQMLGGKENITLISTAEANIGIEMA